MVICVGVSQTSPKAQVTQQVEEALRGKRHGSLLQKVKECLQQAETWPATVEDAFPVGVEVKGMGQVADIRHILIENLKKALGTTDKRKAKAVRRIGIVIAVAMPGFLWTSWIPADNHGFCVVLCPLTEDV